VTETAAQSLVTVEQVNAFLAADFAGGQANGCEACFTVIGLEPMTLTIRPR
jgi:hypothetical protein